MQHRRIQAILDCLPAVASYLDLGCDHCYIAMGIKQRFPQAKVYGSDVRSGPLAIASKLLSEHGMEDIPLFLSDGLQSIPVRCECVVIAGMGGHTIRMILEQGQSYLEQVSYLVLQPNREARDVRAWLAEHGYGIIREALAKERKFYPILAAKKQEVVYDECDLLFGPYLRRERSDLFLQYVQEQYDKNERIIARMHADDVEYQKRLTMRLRYRAILDHKTETALEHPR